MLVDHLEFTEDHFGRPKSHSHGKLSIYKRSMVFINWFTVFEKHDTVHRRNLINKRAAYGRNATEVLFYLPLTMICVRIIDSYNDEGMLSFRIRLIGELDMVYHSVWYYYCAGSSNTLILLCIHNDEIYLTIWLYRCLRKYNFHFFV